MRRGHTEDTGKRPAPESSEWQIRLSKAKVRLDRVNSLKNTYKEVISGMSQDEIQQAQQEDLSHTEHYTDMKFDLDGFAKKYPDLIEKFTIRETKIKQRLSPKYLNFQISEIDSGLKSFSQEFLALCDTVSKREIDLGSLRELESDLQFHENVLSSNNPRQKVSQNLWIPIAVRVNLQVKRGITKLDFWV